MTQSNRAVLAFALGLALVTSVGCSAITERHRQ